MDGNDIAETHRKLTEAAWDGLSQHPKGLSPKWFYDAHGSAVFEQITTQPEYYPARCERSILADRLPDIARHIPHGARLVELGSGASVKTRLMLDELPQLTGYVAVDIAEDFLLSTVSGLSADYPNLEITPVVADFMAPIDLPDLGGNPIVGFFPGSTIGNLEPDAATALLARLRAWPGHVAFILGVDLVKAPEILEAAYDDAQGVTAQFNLNLLTRLNREANADFDLDGFRHRAVWNARQGRVEMHLESLRAQEVRIAGRPVRFEAGETIHTENSYKYSEGGLSRVAAAAGWDVTELLTDRDDMFAVAVLTPKTVG